jgi:hypothetical protein
LNKPSDKTILWSDLISLPFLLALSIMVGPAFISSISILVFLHPFSFLDSHVQIPEHAWRVLVISLVASLGVAIGWLILAKPRQKQSAYSIEIWLAPLPLRFYIYAITAVIMGSLAMQSLPGTIWQTAYHRGMEPFLGIGIFPVFALFAVLGLVAFHVSREHILQFQGVVVAAIAIYVILVCLLFRGARLDATGFVLACLMLIWVRSTRLRVKTLIVLAALIAVVGMHVLGVYRTLASQCALPFGHTVVRALTEPWNLACPPLDKNPELPSVGQAPPPNKFAVIISTPGNVAVSLYQLLGAIKDGSTEFQLGKSYIDYIPRTLPAFIYPDRPKDFGIENINLGLGSLYFLTEAYANFGLLGVGIISVVMGWMCGVATNRLRAGSTFPSIFMFLIVYSLLIRVTWYQFFGLYKSLLSWLFLEVGILLLVHAQVVRGRRQRILLGIKAHDSSAIEHSEVRDRS